jgi:uracil-DNA glycosylase family 4
MNDRWKALEEEIIACRACSRLVEWREKVAVLRKKAYRDESYWGRPVPGFGDDQARVLVVGLAPGAHGANRTGRMFTGDGSGNFLFTGLYKAGFTNQPASRNRWDGLQLEDLYISAVCRCAPPNNKPTPDEKRNCLPYLRREIDLLTSLQGVVALGRIAFEQALEIFRLSSSPLSKFRFSHGSFYYLGNNHPWLIASYHPSRQNTQTGRLNEAMFDSIWSGVRTRISPG